MAELGKAEQQSSQLSWFQIATLPGISPWKSGGLTFEPEMCMLTLSMQYTVHCGLLQDFKELFTEHVIACR